MKSACYTLLLCAFSAVLVAQAATDQGTPAPTPEPATIVLLGAGLAGIGLVAWRRNRKR